MYKHTDIFYEPQHPMLKQFKASGACPRTRPKMEKYKKPKKPFICVTNKCKKDFKDKKEAYEGLEKMVKEYDTGPCKADREKKAADRKAKRDKEKKFDDAARKLIKKNEKLLPKWLTDAFTNKGLDAFRNGLKKHVQSERGGSIEDWTRFLTVKGPKTDAFLKKEIKEFVDYWEKKAKEEEKKCMDGRNWQKCKDWDTILKNKKNW